MRGKKKERLDGDVYYLLSYFVSNFDMKSQSATVIFQIVDIILRDQDLIK